MMKRSGGGEFVQPASAPLAPEFLKGAPLLLRQILWKRGFQTSAEAEAFLSPRLQDFPLPHETLKDIREALQILLQARDEEWPIVIYGDYDVDGASSTALLTQVLRALGFSSVDWFIPHRIQDGYGVTASGAAKLMARFPQTKLVITCDNGISSFEGIEQLKKNSIKVIVTDHHEPPAEGRVAADAILNPKQKDCLYHEKKLAGVGVAFLLLLALRRALKASDFSLTPYLDLVALGTICDVAELTGGNRILVKAGLPLMENSAALGLRVLAQRAPRLSGKLRAKDVGFFIGPRLNASGRVGDPEWGVRTLLASSISEASEWADRLEAQNLNRRQMQEEQMLWAEAASADSNVEDCVWIQDPRFHLGLVGLVASRLSERFKKPACIMTRIDDEHEQALYSASNSSALWKGSLRAPVGYHLAEALNWIRKNHSDLLVSGGGHAQAAGVAVEEKNLERLKTAFNTALRQRERKEREVVFDGEIDGDEDLLDLCQRLEPFGQGNPAPLLRLKGARVREVKVMKAIHMKLSVMKDSNYFSVLQFQSPWVRMWESWGTRSDFDPRQVDLDLLVEPSESLWNGQRRLELMLKDILSAELKGKTLDVRDFGSKDTNAIRARQGVSAPTGHPGSDPAKSGYGGSEPTLPV